MLWRWLAAARWPAVRPCSNCRRAMVLHGKKAHGRHRWSAEQVCKRQELNEEEQIASLMTTLLWRAAERTAARRCSAQLVRDRGGKETVRQLVRVRCWRAEGCQLGGHRTSAACARRGWHSWPRGVWRCLLDHTPRRLPRRGPAARGTCGASHGRAGLPRRDRGRTPEGWARDVWLMRAGGCGVSARERGDASVDTPFVWFSPIQNCETPNPSKSGAKLSDLSP
jgi:hypothetical protein